jgi:hypothetical protein
VIGGAAIVVPQIKSEEIDRRLEQLGAQHSVFSQGRDNGL